MKLLASKHQSVGFGSALKMFRGSGRRNQKRRQNDKEGHEEQQHQDTEKRIRQQEADVLPSSLATQSNHLHFEIAQSHTMNHHERLPAVRNIVLPPLPAQEGTSATHQQGANSMVEPAHNLLTLQAHSLPDYMTEPVEPGIFSKVDQSTAAALFPAVRQIEGSSFAADDSSSHQDYASVMPSLQSTPFSQHVQQHHQNQQQETQLPQLGNLLPPDAKHVTEVDNSHLHQQPQLQQQHITNRPATMWWTTPGGNNDRCSNSSPMINAVSNLNYNLLSQAESALMAPRSYGITQQQNRAGTASSSSGFSAAHSTQDHDFRNTFSQPSAMDYHQASFPFKTPRQEEMKEHGDASNNILARDEGRGEHAGSQRLLLFVEGDSTNLSQYQASIRQNLEFFEATSEDIASTAQGRKKKIEIGQVGIRCIHCSHVASAYRNKASVYYPNTLRSVYQAAQNMAVTHLSSSCEHIPAATRAEIDRLRLKKDTAAGGKSHWASACRKLGLVETENGLRLSKASARSSSKR